MNPDEGINLNPSREIRIPLGVLISVAMAFVGGTLFIAGIYWRLSRMEENQRTVWTLAEEREAYHFFVANGRPADPDDIRTRLAR